MNNNALSVANKFIDLAEADGAQLTPLKLVKLTYLAHGFALVFLKNGETIIDPRFDKVEAWKYFLLDIITLSVMKQKKR